MRTLFGIQYLRALAALMVVAHHARNSQPWLFNPMPDYLALARGVDIFFVISGFIMFTAAGDQPAPEFVRRRVIRIVPLYWIATALALALGALHATVFPPFDVLKSLLFIPFSNPVYGNEIWPVLVPGWTLNYEMFFYLLFAIGLACSRPVAFTAVAILALAASGFVFDFKGAILASYTSPLLLEFLAGVVLGKLFLHYDFSRAWPLLPIGLACIFAQIGGLPDIIGAGLPAVAIVAGALALEKRTSEWAIPKLLGDASYSLYLFHIPFISVLYTVFRRLPLTGWVQFLALMACALVGSAVLSVVIYRYLEKPLTRALNRLSTPRRAGTSFAG
jgi:exopolysaccharide production protein ExoZ